MLDVPLGPVERVSCAVACAFPGAPTAAAAVFRIFEAAAAGVAFVAIVTTTGLPFASCADEAALVVVFEGAVEVLAFDAGVSVDT